MGDAEGWLSGGRKWPHPIERLPTTTTARVPLGPGDQAGLEQRDRFGRGYLHWAALSGSRDACDVLLKCGLLSLRMSPGSVLFITKSRSHEQKFLYVCGKHASRRSLRIKSQ